MGIFITAYPWIVVGQGSSDTVHMDNSGLHYTLYHSPVGDCESRKFLAWYQILLAIYHVLWDQETILQEDMHSL